MTGTRLLHKSLGQAPIQAELGTLLSRQAQLDEAPPLLEEARQELARIVGEDDDLTLGCDENLAAAYLRDGRSEDALRRSRKGAWHTPPRNPLPAAGS